MRNPFQDTKSPIEDLYHRSRSKSIQNRFSTRSRSSSYRQFQVKIIQQALKCNHIISKQCQGEQNRTLQRERRRSKYLGIQSQRYDCPSIQQQTAEVEIKDEYFMTKQSQEMGRSVRFEMKAGVLQEVVVPQRREAGSGKKMPFECSQYFINQPYISQAQLKSQKLLVSHRAQNQRKISQERKCSITDSLREDELSEKKGFPNKNMIDLIREEYFQSIGGRSSKQSFGELASTYYR